MMEKPELTSYVLLKNGTMLECTSKQKEALGLAILMAPDLSTQRVKLGGEIFTLDQLEHDPKKIYAMRQQGMELGDTKAKQTTTEFEKK